MKSVKDGPQLLPLVQRLWWVRSRQEYKLPRTAVRQVIEPEQVRWVPSDYFRLPQHRGMLTIIRLGLPILDMLVQESRYQHELSRGAFWEHNFFNFQTEAGLFARSGSLYRIQNLFHLFRASLKFPVHILVMLFEL